jgi:hypothetical protein
VEYYSEKNDSIALYFIDKISALSCEVPNLQELDESLTKSMIKEAEENQNQLDARFKTLTTSPTTPSPTYDPESKKRERSKNAQINIQVNKVKKKPHALSILQSYYEEWEKNNKIVMEDIKNQRKQLEAKLTSIRTFTLI